MNYKNLEISNEIYEYLKNKPHLYENRGLMNEIASKIKYYNKQYNSAVKKDEVHAYRLFIEAIDKVMHELMPAMDKAKISCKKGCAWCCNYNVDIMPTEAIVISRYCKKNYIPINKSYLEEQLKHSVINISRSNVSACIFLKDGECSIYTVRPLACRKLLVVSQPKYCNSKEYPPNTSVVRYFDFTIQILSSVLITKQGNGSGRLPALLLPYAV